MTHPIPYAHIHNPITPISIHLGSSVVRGCVITVRVHVKEVEVRVCLHGRNATLGRLATAQIISCWKDSGTPLTRLVHEPSVAAAAVACLFVCMYV